MIDLQIAALGVAIGEEWNEVREVGGNNTGPKIMEYLANIDPPINTAAPWCAAFVQAVTDYAASKLGMSNPLDGVRLEAYVQSYYDWAAPRRLVRPEDVQSGDLVLFDFRGIRWDHIGFVLQPPRDGTTFRTIEGNTSDESQRDGDAVAIKLRSVSARYPTAFIRWAR